MDHIRNSTLRSREGTGKILTIVLASMLFWIGLGVGTSTNDTRYWVESTWMVIWLEWGYIGLYLLLTRHFPFKELWKHHRTVALVATAWALTVLISYLITPYYGTWNILARMRLVETYSHVLFFLFLWDTFSRYPVNYRALFLAVIASTLVVGAYFLYIHIAYSNLHAVDGVFSIPSKDFILNTHLHRVGYQVMVSIVLLLPFLDVKRVAGRVLAWVTMFILWYFLIWLGGRAAILASTIALLGWIYTQRERIDWKIFVPIIALVLAVVLLILWWRGDQLGYISHIIDRTLHANSLNRLLSNRLTVWGLVIQNLEGNCLLGNGPQSYFFYTHRPDEVIHAHNFLLQFLGEWGILGTVLALFLIVKAIGYGLKIQSSLDEKEKRIHVSAGLLIMALLVSGLFGGIFFIAQTCVYLDLAFAVWVGNSEIVYKRLQNN